MASDKDTIYIDIDDEITGIIDKLKASEGKVAALVLPKRAAVFQSIVNMKLLKRAADSSKKNLVLITSEAGLLPLAGAAGIHVAKTLTSKPEIPAGPQGMEDIEETVDESDALAAEPAIDSNKPVGELAGPTAAAGAAEGVETLVLDDEDLPPENTAAPAPKTFAPSAKKDKKLKIPNFDRFRLWLLLGALLLLLLIAGIIFTTVALPKATINVKTDATNLDTNLGLNLSTAATALDPGSGTLPANLEQMQKTYTQQVPTTGQKNTGNKASGSVTITAKECSTSAPDDVPAGTGVSNNGQTYITQSNTSFSASGNNDHHGCFTYSATGSTQIIAQNGGSSYNQPGGSNFAVAGRSDDVTASGSASGGTDNIVQSVNQNDISNAKSKISTNDTGAKQALDGQTQKDGYYPLDVTFSTGTPNVTASASVGEVATTVTVTETVTYTMFGVHKDDLKSLLDGNIKTQIDTSKQSILDDGLGRAVFNVNNISATSASISMSTKAEVGPELDVNSIKSTSAGQKAGAIKSQLSSNPDVTRVDVKISPFWVSTAPKKTSRITVHIAKPTTTKTNSNGTNP